jgi:two-component system nitrogen regulation sensor histidine kinase NtrY
VPELCGRTSSSPSSPPRPKGTGVGLSLARQIVLAHGGSIALAESESGGALFRIVL